MNIINVINNSIVHKRVGKCIYCLSCDRKLSDEHIIPFGLNGRWILDKASCSRCSKITSAFETDVLGNIFYSTRASFGLKKRHGHYPKTFILRGEIDGRLHEKVVSVASHGAVICLLGYKQPAYLDGRQYKNGIDVTDSYLIRTNGRDLSGLGRELGFTTISFTNKFRQQNFERFLEKIAYGFAVLKYGVDAFEEVYVLPSLLGKVDDVGRWLGSFPPETSNEDIRVGFSEKNKEVLVDIRLFGKLPVPTYVVVVGKLR